MKTILIALLTTLALPAAWNFQTITGASEGAIASRTFGTTEMTYIAYRDQSGTLSVATLGRGTLQPQTIWPRISPSHTSISISTTGSVIVTFWSADKFRYALFIGNGNGNCGPSSEWRCGDILFPAGVTAAQIDRVVGSVDGIFRAHFFYNLRTYASPINNPHNGLYYAALTANGFWAGPYLQDDNNGSSSPTALEVAGPLTEPFFLTTVVLGVQNAQTGLGTLGSGIISEPSLTLVPLGGATDSSITHIDMDAKNQPLAGCLSKGPGINSSYASQIRVLRRTTTDPAFVNTSTIVYDGTTQGYKPTT